MNNGEKVNSIAQFDLRKAEILELFEEYVYGKMPNNNYLTSFETVETGYNSEYNAIRQQIKITITTNKGSNEALMLMYIPVRDEPVNVIVGLNFLGNHTISNDPNIISSYGIKDTDSVNKKRGIRNLRWPVESIISNGYALATMYYGDWAEDNHKTYQDRMIRLFDEKNFQSVSAWAFGLKCGIDYLVQDDRINSDRVASIGHSRLGKVSLWAGANDERISLVIANGSGNSGAALSRGNRGETVRYINYKFPHWFTDKYKQYNYRVNDLPLDQHMLLALIAPRQLYLGNANYDLWADPNGTLNSLNYAMEAYKLYEIHLVTEIPHQPMINEPKHSEYIGYHLREGGHNITPLDWQFYLDYMRKFWN